MILTFVNKTKIPLKKAFLKRWIALVEKELKQKISDKELSLIFVGSAAMKKLNRRYRGKDYVTDILSFGELSANSLPELVICPQVIKKQAGEHKLTYNLELGYLVLHGILHLLGYDHEHGGRKAKEMYKLQDKIFAKLRAKI